MSPRGKNHRYYRLAIDKAREALRHGPLVRPALGNYHSGAKFFSHRTVNALIDSGEAVRVGTGVIHADHIRKQAAE